MLATGVSKSQYSLKRVLISHLVRQAPSLPALLGRCGSQGTEVQQVVQGEWRGWDLTHQPAPRPLLLTTALCALSQAAHSRLAGSPQPVHQCHQGLLTNTIHVPLSYHMTPPYPTLENTAAALALSLSLSSSKRLPHLSWATLLFNPE